MVSPWKTGKWISQNGRSDSPFKNETAQNFGQKRIWYNWSDACGSLSIGFNRIWIGPLDVDMKVFYIRGYRENLSWFGVFLVLLKFITINRKTILIFSAFCHPASNICQCSAWEKKKNNLPNLLNYFKAWSFTPDASQWEFGVLKESRIRPLVAFIT